MQSWPLENSMYYYAIAIHAMFMILLEIFLYIRKTINEVGLRAGFTKKERVWLIRQTVCAVFLIRHLVKS